MALLSRLHWWTVEYGLIGTLEKPKIYGAGLLSSIGESVSCLEPNVKKLPYSVDAAEYSLSTSPPNSRSSLFAAISSISPTCSKNSRADGFHGRRHRRHQQSDRMQERHDLRVFIRFAGYRRLYEVIDDANDQSDLSATNGPNRARLSEQGTCRTWPRLSQRWFRFADRKLEAERRSLKAEKTRAGIRKRGYR